MPNDNNAWLIQAENDYNMAKLAHEKNYYEWSIFCACQSAEKVIKANILTIVPGISKRDLYDHTLSNLIKKFPEKLVNEEIEIDCKKIDDVFQYSRYPSKQRGNKAPNEIFEDSDCRDILEIAKKLSNYFKNIYDNLQNLLNEFSVPKY